MLPALQTDRTRLATLDAQILDLERSLASIRAEKALVQERLDAYKYPVLTLPNEITSEIFLQFPPVYPACPPLYGTLSPTNLTLICRKWRAVALAIPALWRAIQFDESVNPTQQIDNWLSMARSCPIAVQANVSEGRLEEAMAVIAPHRLRWEYLKFHCFILSRQPLLELESPMPLLRHLDLASSTYDPTYGSSDPIVLGAAPLLHSVILNEITVEKFVLPWLQLTSLTLNSVWPGESMQILRQTPHLLHCNLALFIGAEIVGPDLTLLRLESLVLVEEAPEGDRIEFLNSFIFPALRTLQIAEEFLGTKPCDSLSSFIAKSGCKIQELTIGGERFVANDVYIRLFPSIPLSFEGRYLEEADVPSDIDSPTWEV
ncbi:hypothetical protein C8R46DRAFT_1190514 [Mycena filopes]|nr:hypothetical protein C8R46DRAFT_1190514 [Mycena filopes]